MKIILKHLHHIPSRSLTALIQKQLEDIGRTRQIDEARVTVERRLEASPPFRVSAHLVTPGPDVCAAANDHTFRAALQKTMAQLTACIGHRQLKSVQRARSKQTTNQSTRHAAPGLRSR